MIFKLTVFIQVGKIQYLPNVTFWKMLYNVHMWFVFRTLQKLIKPYFWVFTLLVAGEHLEACLRFFHLALVQLLELQNVRTCLHKFSRWLNMKWGYWAVDHKDKIVPQSPCSCFDQLYLYLHFGAFTVSMCPGKTCAALSKARLPVRASFRSRIFIKNPNKNSTYRLLV